MLFKTRPTARGKAVWGLQRDSQHVAALLHRPYESGLSAGRLVQFSEMLKYFLTIQ